MKTPMTCWGETPPNSGNDKNSGKPQTSIVNGEISVAVSFPTTTSNPESRVSSSKINVRRSFS